VVKIGTYDTITFEKKDNFRCPYCNEIIEVGFQTKDGDYFMNRFKVGDVFQGGLYAGKFKFITAIGSCESEICQFEAAKESVWNYGYYGGFSRSFDVRIYLDNQGRITNKVELLKLHNHKGLMHGKLGELKGKEDNMKIVRYADYTKLKSKFIPEKKVRMTTDGWLDKFKEDSFDGGIKNYENILYFFNIEDGEDAMMLWFILRYHLDKIIECFRFDLGGKPKTDEEVASMFLSNEWRDPKIREIIQRNLDRRANEKQK
jgi:hypothetical protein